MSGRDKRPAGLQEAGAPSPAQATAAPGVPSADELLATKASLWLRTPDTLAAGEALPVWHDARGLEPGKAVAPPQDVRDTPRLQVHDGRRGLGGAGGVMYRAALVQRAPFSLVCVAVAAGDCTLLALGAAGSSGGVELCHGYPRSGFTVAAPEIALAGRLGHAVDRTNAPSDEEDVQDVHVMSGRTRSDGRWHIYVATVRAAEEDGPSEIWVDGHLEARSCDVCAATISSLVVGSKADGHYPLVGAVAELAVVDGALDGDVLRRLFARLSRRHGIRLDPPEPSPSLRLAGTGARMGAAHLDLLGKDLWTRILAALGPTDVARADRVCRTLAAAVHDAPLMELAVRREWPTRGELAAGLTTPAASRAARCWPRRADDARRYVLRRDWMWQELRSPFGAAAVAAVRTGVPPPRLPPSARGLAARELWHLLWRGVARRLAREDLLWSRGSPRRHRFVRWELVPPEGRGRRVLNVSAASSSLSSSAPRGRHSILVNMGARLHLRRPEWDEWLTLDLAGAGAWAADLAIALPECRSDAAAAAAAGVGVAFAVAGKGLVLADTARWPRGARVYSGDPGGKKATPRTRGTGSGALALHGTGCAVFAIFRGSAGPLRVDRDRGSSAQSQFPGHHVHAASLVRNDVVFTASAEGHVLAWTLKLGVALPLVLLEPADVAEYGGAAMHGIQFASATTVATVHCSGAVVVIWDACTPKVKLWQVQLGAGAVLLGLRSTTIVARTGAGQVAVWRRAATTATTQHVGLGPGPAKLLSRNMLVRLGPDLHAGDVVDLAVGRRGAADKDDDEEVDDDDAGWDDISSTATCDAGTVVAVAQERSTGKIAIRLVMPRAAGDRGEEKRHCEQEKKTRTAGGRRRLADKKKG